VRWSSCRPGLEKSKRATESIQSATSASETSSAVEPTAKGLSGSVQTAKAPAIGRKIRAVESQCTYRTTTKTTVRMARLAAIASV
jgi:hypothetical protein